MRERARERERKTSLMMITSAALWSDQIGFCGQTNKQMCTLVWAEISGERVVRFYVMQLDAQLGELTMLTELAQLPLDLDEINEMEHGKERERER